MTKVLEDESSTSLPSTALYAGNLQKPREPRVLWLLLAVDFMLG
jgi:hypothetical protein